MSDALARTMRHTQAHQIMVASVLDELVAQYPGGWAALNDKIVAKLDSRPDVAADPDLRRQIAQQWGDIGVRDLR